MDLLKTVCKRKVQKYELNFEKKKKISRNVESRIVLLFKNKKASEIKKKTVSKTTVILVEKRNSLATSGNSVGQPRILNDYNAHDIERLICKNYEKYKI